MLRLTENKIWRDPDFRRLDAECKLAFHWLITNDGCNSIGLTETTPEDFSHDTGMTWEVMQRLLDTPISRNIIVSDRQGTVLILLLNFCSYQWKGKQLSPTSHVGKSICVTAAALPDNLREPFMKRYPHLHGTVSDLLQGVDRMVTVTRPPGYSGLATLPSSSSFPEQPTDEEVLAFAGEWPGELATGTPRIDSEFAVAWLARMNARSGGWPANWRRALVAEWRSRHRTFTATGGGDAGFGQKNKNGVRQLWQVDADLERVRAAIQDHPVSRAALGQEFSEEQRSEHAQLKARRDELKRERASLMAVEEASALAR